MTLHMLVQRFQSAESERGLPNDFKKGEEVCEKYAFLLNRTLFR